MWILTYVGALFNGLTLLILGEKTHFPSCPEALTDEFSFGSIWWCYEKIHAETFCSVTRSLSAVFSLTFYLKSKRWVLKFWWQNSTFLLLRLQVWLECSAARSSTRNTRWESSWWWWSFNIVNNATHITLEPVQSEKIRRQLFCSVYYLLFVSC